MQRVYVLLRYSITQTDTDYFVRIIERKEEGISSGFLFLAYILQYYFITFEVSSFLEQDRCSIWFVTRVGAWYVSLHV